ncbi:hypothetical protein [Nocardiopsis sp. CC223A]|uniref:hypothetical protein n=1 Tax=Nocardiopsis sp. CC223A TaxID=3044051 RepID=UPI00278BC0B5|nr:hypothetical protein [Nocardiopsis sp. CC223A]
MTHHDPAADAAERYRLDREQEAARERELRRIREERLRGGEPRRFGRFRGRRRPAGDYDLAG